MTYRDLIQRQPVQPAPMCGISDFAQRAICRRMGAQMTWTQMVSAEAIWRGDKKTLEILDLQADHPEHPLGMQLFGGQPEALAYAAQVLQDLGADVIDLNMGCPARKINVSHAGAALLKDLPRVERIFRAMRRVIQVPFTAKLRWDWDDNPAGESASLQVARMAQAEGLDALCLHARTREQGYSGVANWELIARLKEAAPALPVLGNGDIRIPADALAMMRQSGCEGVMIGRGIIGDPWLLGESLDAVRQGRTPAERRVPDWPERRRLMGEHARLMAETKGARGLVQFRKHAAAYLRGLHGAKQLRVRLMQVTTIDELDQILGEWDPNTPEPALA